MYPVTDEFPFRRSAPLVAEWPFGLNSLNMIHKVLNINSLSSMLFEIPIGKCFFLYFGEARGHLCFFLFAIPRFPCSQSSTANAANKNAGAAGWQYPLNYKSTLDYLNLLEQFDSGK